MVLKFDLGDYLTDLFIETGIGEGDNLIAALHAGFRDIHGIETSPARHGKARENVARELGRRSWHSNVMLYCGSPTVGLDQVCPQAQHKRATILLDSTGSYGAARPVLDEIGIVRRWFQDALIPPIIMVGGLKDGNGGPAAPGLSGVIEALLDLCAEYQFRILDDEQPRNILVALPPTWVQAA